MATRNYPQSSKLLRLISGSVGALLTLGFGGQAIASHTPSDLLALAPQSPEEIRPGTFYCINNHDLRCKGTTYYTSPWSFTPKGFRAEYYASIAAGTGPSASQQATLRQAMTKYNEYLDTQNTAACLHNSSRYCN
jgi:hypothetical protein